MYAGTLAAPGNQKLGADVLEKIKPVLAKQPNAEIVRNPTDYDFGGETFSRMDVKWALPKGGVSYSGDAVTIRRGYLIQFTIFADSLEQLDVLYQTLNSLQFKR
jgi:hypothetical protein